MFKSLIDDARICLSIFTRLPITPPKSSLSPVNEEQNLNKIGKAYRAAPIVSLVVGLAGAIAYTIGISMHGSPVHIAAILAVATQLLISGGTEEIGLAKVLSLRPHPSADTSGRDEGMGIAVGAVTVGIALLLKIFLVAELTLPWYAAMGLIASSALGRAAQVQLMAFTSDNSESQPSKIDATTSMIVGGIIGAIALVLMSRQYFFMPAFGALLGMAISIILFFTLTKCRQHLDNLHVREALAFVAEIGALFGIVAFLPSLGG